MLNLIIRFLEKIQWKLRYLKHGKDVVFIRDNKTGKWNKASKEFTDWYYEKDEVLYQNHSDEEVKDMLELFKNVCNSADF